MQLLYAILILGISILGATANTAQTYTLNCGAGKKLTLGSDTTQQDDVGTNFPSCVTCTSNTHAAAANHTFQVYWDIALQKNILNTSSFTPTLCTGCNADYFHSGTQGGEGCTQCVTGSSQALSTAPAQETYCDTCDIGFYSAADKICTAYDAATYVAPTDTTDNDGTGSPFSGTCADNHFSKSAAVVVAGGNIRRLNGEEKNQCFACGSDVTTFNDNFTESTGVLNDGTTPNGCIKCLDGYYANHMNACRPCEGDKTTPDSVADRLTDTQGDTVASACTVCKDDFRWSGTACVACGANQNSQNLAASGTQNYCTCDATYPGDGSNGCKAACPTGSSPTTTDPNVDGSCIAEEALPGRTRRAAHGWYIEFPQHPSTTNIVQLQTETPSVGILVNEVFTAQDDTTAYCDGAATTGTFDDCVSTAGVYVAASGDAPATCNDDTFSGSQNDCETKRRVPTGKLYVAAGETLVVKYDGGCGTDGYCNDAVGIQQSNIFGNQEECEAANNTWVSAQVRNQADDKFAGSAVTSAWAANKYSVKLVWDLCRAAEITDSARNNGHLTITENGDADPTRGRNVAQDRKSQLETLLTQDKCYIPKGSNSVLKAWSGVFDADPDTEPYGLMSNTDNKDAITCNTGYRLDRDQSECTVDVSSGTRNVLIQHCTNALDLNEKTTDSSDDAREPQIAADSHIAGDTANKDKCRFFPPNMIFNDDLIVGYQLDSDGKLVKDTNEALPDENKPFFSEDDAMSKVRVIFNRDVLDTEVSDNYDYYILAESTGGSRNFENVLSKSHQTALINNDILTDIKVSSSGESGSDGPVEASTDDGYDGDDSNYALDAGTLQTDSICDAGADCVDVTSVTVHKQYQIIVGAASKCFEAFNNKQHIFVRAKYTITTEFELKYAPGINLGSSGFTEVAKGVWARNRISDSEPTVLMHSDYTETLGNKVKASQTVKHAALGVQTSLDLLTDAQGGSAGVNENNGYVGESGTDDTGVCADSGTHGDDENSPLQGSNITTNTTDGTETGYTTNQNQCFFRSSMVIYQEAVVSSGTPLALRMASTLGGYEVDLAVAQYAQYNPYNAMKELQDSRIPDGFMGAISDPAINEANGFGQDGGQDSAEDVRFDVCRCRASQTSNTQVNGGGLLPGNETNLGSWNKGCRYNKALSDALGARAVEYTNMNLAQYVHDGEPELTGTKQITNVQEAIAQGLTDDTNKITGTRTFRNTDDTSKTTAGGIFAACTYSPFFPEPWVYTPYSYVRSWYEFGQAKNIDHIGHDARRLMRGNRVLKSGSTEQAPPTVRHSLYFKFKK